MIEHPVSRAEAERLVQAQLERECRRYAAVYGPPAADAGRIRSVENVDVGWLVFCSVFETVHDAAGTPGNDAYLVDGEDGALFVVPAHARASKEWIEDFRVRFKGQTPDPLTEATREVRQVSATEGRMPAVRRLRSLAPGLGVTEAASAVDSIAGGGALPADVRGRLTDRPARQFAAPIHPVTAEQTPEAGGETSGVDAARLRVVGDFHELGRGGNPEAPSIRWARRPRAAPYEPELVRYLKTGSVLAAMPAVVSDVLGAQGSVICGLSLCTDGVWLWHSDLAHYVERYHVELDPRFLAHARSREWQAPRLTDLELLGIEEELFGADPEAALQRASG